MAVTQLALTWVGWPNGETLLWLACKFDLDQSEHKSSQVNASARNAWPNGVASFQLASTCDSVWPGLKKTSNILIFKVIQYHHKLLCTFNSLVFEVCFCLLFLKSIMITLTVCSFGVIWIMISDPGSLTWFIKGNSSFDAPWRTIGPDSDTPKKCTLYLYWTFC